MANASSPAKTLYCSFCFKSQHEVTKLISGPAAIFICSECLEVCNDYVAHGKAASKPRSPEKLPTEHLLQRLSAIELTLTGKGSQLESVVDILRSRHVSWADIGAAIGMSRQSAWERFS